MFPALTKSWLPLYIGMEWENNWTGLLRKRMQFLTSRKQAKRNIKQMTNFSIQLLSFRVVALGVTVVRLLLLKIFVKLCSLEMLSVSFLKFISVLLLYTFLKSKIVY